MVSRSSAARPLPEPREPRFIEADPEKVDRDRAAFAKKMEGRKWYRPDGRRPSGSYIVLESENEVFGPLMNTLPKSKCFLCGERMEYGRPFYRSPDGGWIHAHVDCCREAGYEHDPTGGSPVHDPALPDDGTMTPYEKWLDEEAKRP